MSNKYTEGFKEQAVQKALTRGQMTLKSLALALSVGYSTIQRWIRCYKMISPHDKESRRPQDWTREKQLQAIIDCSLLDETQRSEYCRQKGIYPHQLDEWRLNILQIDTDVAKNHKAQIKELQEEMALLQKEICRKDKALAETAALLVLQKKFQALLEDEEK